MTTKSDLLALIEAAEGFIEMHLLKTESVDTTKRYQYALVYRVGGYPRADVFNIIVFNDGLETESAEWMDHLPAILDVAVDSAWKTAVLTKKTNLLANNANIKRIDIKRINEEETYALATAYTLVSGKIAATNYFLYNANGTLTFYEYTGTLL